MLSGFSANSPVKDFEVASSNLRQQAIEVITNYREWAKSNPKVIEQLRGIAEEPGIAECPRKDAWQALADLHALSGEVYVARDEELVEAPSLGCRQDRAERVEVAVDVRKAEEQHGDAGEYEIRPGG